MTITQGGEEDVTNMDTLEDTLELVSAEQVARRAGHGVVGQQAGGGGVIALSQAGIVKGVPCRD